MLEQIISNLGDFLFNVFWFIRFGTQIQGMINLFVLAAVTVLPLTLVRPEYCFTVGYGASIASMSFGLIVSLLFDYHNNLLIAHSGIQKDNIHDDPICYWLVRATFCYGIRLATFLVVRKLRVPNMSEQTKAMEKYSRLSCTPLALFLSLFYTIMMSPVYFAIRFANKSPPSMQGFESNNEKHCLFLFVQWMGVLVAWGGLALETTADQQKFMTKHHHHVAYGEKRFVGPTNGTYSLCRHPNFCGEITFWSGVLVASLPALLSSSWFEWCCSLLGYIGIVQIMVGSANSLEKKQQKWYGGQPMYEEWKQHVQSSLFPKLVTYTSKNND